MSTTTKTTPNAADLRTARLAACRTTADETAVQELGTEANREVSVTSALTTTVKTGTKTRTANVSATVGLNVNETETDSADEAKK